MVPGGYRNSVAVPMVAGDNKDPLTVSEVPTVVAGDDKNPLEVLMDSICLMSSGMELHLLYVVLL